MEAPWEPQAGAGRRLQGSPSPPSLEWKADPMEQLITTDPKIALGKPVVAGTRITVEHILAMKDQAIVCNIGHFDNEIDIAGVEKYKWEEIKPQVDHVIFPAANGRSSAI